MAKVKLEIGGKQIEAEHMSFKTVEEPWSIYRTEDGTVLRMKLVVSDVYKLPGKDPTTGLPQFVVRSSNILTVEPSAAKPGGVH